MPNLLMSPPEREALKFCLHLPQKARVSDGVNGNVLYAVAGLYPLPLHFITARTALRSPSLRTCSAETLRRLFRIRRVVRAVECSALAPPLCPL